MRIALIAPPWLPVPPPGYGGTEVVVDRLATGFHAAGHDVLLFTTGDSSCPVPKAFVRSLAAPEQLGQSFVELQHLIHAYDAVGDFDIVHDHTITGPIYAEGHCDAHVVTTNHGPFTEELDDIYGRAAAAGVSVIAISQHQASQATARVAAVIHHGLPPAEFRVGQGDGGYFLFLGRFSPDKGAREAALAAREAGVPALLAAKMREPAEVEYFHEEVEPLLNDDVRYVGEVDFERKLELLGSARALLNPIQWPEPFGLVMIEALACGTPVVAFRSGSAPEIVDDGRTGFVCETLEELIDRIPHVGDLDRSECRQVLEERFSAERMVRDHLRLFERLLSG
jgi:glycosyltransferase involved in cell wall biosynthesis